MQKHNIVLDTSPPISIITESFKPSKAKAVKTDSNKLSYGVAVCRNTSKLS